MPHDFKRFPELTNSQMNFYYWDSPHKQITEGFIGKVIKVTDGDTIRLETNFRDFLTTVRFAFINAPEMSEGGKESKAWLENRLMNKEVYIKVDPYNRVGKWGRIIGEVFSDGININYESLANFHSVPFGQEFI